MRRCPPSTLPESAIRKLTDITKKLNREVCRQTGHKRLFLKIFQVNSELPVSIQNSQENLEKLSLGVKDNAHMEHPVGGPGSISVRKKPKKKKY